MQKFYFPQTGSAKRTASTRIIRVLTVVIILSAASISFASRPDVIQASRHDTSPALSQMAGQSPSSTVGTDRQTPTALATGPAVSSAKSDPVAQQFAGALTGVSTVSNFDGQSAQDTRNLLGFAYVPPDTNGAVGASQFVQMVNVTIAVYEKSTGALQLGPALIHTIWTGFGGPCELAGDGGDPVVLYDHLANRWFVSQLQFNSNFTQNEECVAVSASSDATGSYHRYEFDFGADFPDYPKFSVWPDAYYNTVNIFAAKGFAGARACALNRNAMLAGTSANMICFQQAPSVASLLPADLDGSTLPPAGEPDFFVDLRDSTHLNLFKFHVDFTNTENSTFTGPTLISVASYSEICARANTLACIPEPPPGEKVDGLSDRLMFRLAYRNFGDHESLVANHTVKGGALAGVRWYEIRNPASAPVAYQQETLVDPSTDYWLGSIAMDQAGDIAVGFSASSRKLFPSLYVAARAATDPLNTMSGPLVLFNGTGSQFSSFKRWGDYSSMSVDPNDDCTFWYTNEYYPITSSFNWRTRIGAFKFDSCKAHGR